MPYSNAYHAVIILLLVVIVAILMRKCNCCSGSKSHMGHKNHMSVGAHWLQNGSYSHTPATLPSFDYSGYNQAVPTPANV